MPFTEKFTFFRKKKVGETTPVLATFSISPATSIVNGNINAVFNVATSLTTSPTLVWDTLYETANIFIDNTTTGTVIPNGAGIGSITRQVYDDAQFALQLKYANKTLATSANVTVQNINYTFSNVSSPFYNNASFNIATILPVGTTVYWTLSGTNTGIFTANNGSVVVGAGGNITLPLSISSSTQYYSESTFAVQLRSVSTTGRVIATSSNYIAVRSPEYFALHPIRGGYTAPANVSGTASLSNISVSYNGRWQGAVLAPGGNIYAAPANASTTSRILKINTNTSAVTDLTLPSAPPGTTGTAYHWKGGLLSSATNDGTSTKITFIPGPVRWVLNLDTANDNRTASIRTGDITGTGDVLDILSLGGVGWSGGALTPTSNIYQPYQGNIMAAPAERNRHLLINSQSSSTYTTNFESNYTYEPRPFGSIPGETITDWQNNQRAKMLYTPPFVEDFGSGNVMWDGAVVRNNGNVVYIPHNAPSYAEVNPTTGATTFVPIGGTGGNKWRGGCLGNDGSIYFAPYTSTTIYRLFPDGSSATYAVSAGTAKYTGAVAAPDGKIYFIPRTATSVLVLDPATGTTTTLGTFGSEVKWEGGVLAPNGSIYCIPNGNGTPVLRINLGIGSIDPGHWMLSSYYNKY